MRRFMLRHVPLWTDVRIATSCKYLGLMLGPSVTAQDRWKEAINKYWQRAAALGHSAASAFINARSYNLRILSASTTGII
jgi:hypothetical protein